MTLSAGTRLGPYEILESIGKGGMGEVFRASDTRLHRTVAIKILPHDKVADPDRKRRFLLEARAASALNHPNIITLHDIASDNGLDYLVMEYVPGQSLDKLITPKGLPLNDAIRYAIQIAGALEAAHAAGIVHRDIKPANMIVTAEGNVKVLDFGLAKLEERAPNPDGETQTMLTQAGTVMGTVAYMSPEQARAEEVDARTDLFSFGAVLYEMATGKRAFRRALDWTPPPTDALPPKLRPIVLKLLECDLDLRYQTAADVAADLKRLQRANEVKPGPARYAALGIPLLFALAGGIWYLRAPKGPVTVPSEFVQLTNFSDNATAPAISRDGTMVAFFRGGAYFLGSGQVYVKMLSSGESKQLTNDPNPKYDPVFTPDGSRVAYTKRNLATRTWDTWTVPVLGGPATRLMLNAAGLSWITPDRVLFSEIMSGTVLHMGIVTSRENRAEERKLYFPPHERAMAHYSYPSPDQRSILVVEMDRAAAWQRCRLLPMDGSSAGTPVGPQGACTAAGWSPDGRWMYLNMEVDGSTHLWRQRGADGIPEQITFGPNEEEGLAVAPDGKSLIASIGARRSSVLMHDTEGDHPIPVEGSVSQPTYSSDGKRLYYVVQKGTSRDLPELWSRELESGKSELVLAEGIAPGQALRERVANYDVSGDQKNVAFSVRTSSTTNIFIAPVDRGSAPRLVTKDGDSVSFGGAGTLLFRQLGEKANYLARIQSDGTRLERIMETPIVGKGSVSPDGEWVVVGGVTDPTKPPGMYAVSLRDRSRRLVCAGECLIRWSLDGKFLFVSTTHRLTSAGRTLVIPLPRGFAATAFPEAGFDRASDEELTAIRVIQQAEVWPGPDADTYAYTTSAFQGNLFRIPLH